MNKKSLKKNIVRKNHISNNSSLSNRYDEIFKKGEQKHFTSFLTSGDPSSEALEVLKQIKWKNKKIVDIGCGTGNFAFLASKKGANVLGIDYSEIAIKQAKKKFVQKNLEFKKMNVFELKEKFDVIVSIGTLEHTDNPLKTLKFLKRHLTKNGKLIITSPNWVNPRGYILMTLFHLFDARITLLDLHHFTPVDFIKWSEILNMKLKWKTFDHSWAHGQKLVDDFKKRIPKILSDMGIDNKNKQVKIFLDWIKTNILSFDNSSYHSGAIGLYIFSSKNK